MEPRRQANRDAQRARRLRLRIARQQGADAGDLRWLDAYQRRHGRPSVAELRAAVGRVDPGPAVIADDGHRPDDGHRVIDPVIGLSSAASSEAPPAPAATGDAGASPAASSAPAASPDAGAPPMPGLTEPAPVTAEEAFAAESRAELEQMLAELEPHGGLTGAYCAWLKTEAEKMRSTGWPAIPDLIIDTVIRANARYLEKTVVLPWLREHVTFSRPVAVGVTATPAIYAIVHRYLGKPKAAAPPAKDAPAAKHAAPEPEPAPAPTPAAPGQVYAVG